MYEVKIAARYKKKRTKNERKVMQRSKTLRGYACAIVARGINRQNKPMQSSHTHYLCWESPVHRKFLVSIASLVRLITMQASKQGLHLQALQLMVELSLVKATGMLLQENPDTSPALQKCFPNPTTLVVNKVPRMFFPASSRCTVLGNLRSCTACIPCLAPKTACTPALSLAFSMLRKMP